MANSPPGDNQNADFSRIRSAAASAGVQTANAEAALTGASNNPRFPLAAANVINRGNSIASLGTDVPTYLDAARGTGIGPSAAFDRASKGAFLAASALGVLALVTAAPAVLVAGVAFTALGVAFAVASRATEPLDDPDCPDEPDPNRPRPGFPVPFNRPPISPVIFDLNGDGVQTIGLDQSSTFFDLDGDGRAERTSWAAPEDGLLVLDRNGNGTIDDITELFGSETRDGFFELDQFLTEVETNGGVRATNGNLLTEADLRVWRDANSDGISQADEIFTLEELNIAEIPRVGSTVPLDSTIPVDERPDFFGFDENGNRISSIGQGLFADGTSFDVADIFFNNDPTSVRPSDASLDPLAAILPDLPGGARFDDLRDAASENEALRELILDTVQNANSFSGAELRSAVEAIVLEWTGIADQDLPSRGQFIDPEPLALLELIFGATFQQTAGTNAGTSNPGPSAANELRQTYEVVLDRFVTQFSSQIYSAQLELALIGDFDPIEALTSPFAALSELFYDRDEQTVTTIDFDGLIGTIIDGIPDGTTAEKIAYLDLIGSSLTGLRADQFAAENDFIENGNDEVFESAVRSAFAVLEDRALREIAVARVLGAQRLIGTDAATEVLDANDPDLFRDLNGVSSILEGGLGNDTLIGGNGGDIYVFAPGDGLDRVEDRGSENRQIDTARPISEGGQSGNPGGVDRLVFLDRSVNDVSFAINGANLILTFADNPGDSVLIPGVLRDESIANGIEQLIFQDGVISGEDLQQIIEDGDVDFTSTLPSTPGDDIIQGTSGTDRYLLADGIGNDTILAGFFDTTVDLLLVDFNRDDVVVAVGNGGLLVTTTQETTDQHGNSITVRGPDSVFFDDFSRPGGSSSFRYNLRSIQFLDDQDSFFNLLQEIDREDSTFLPNDFEGLELVRGVELDGAVVNSSFGEINLFIVDDGAIVADLGRQFSIFSEIGDNFVFGDGRILSREEVARLVPLVNFSPDEASVLNGSIFGETVVGGIQSDTINAGRGDDTIEAGEGDDDVVAGRGDDVIIGGLGDDRLAGDDASSVGSFGSNGPDEVGSDTFVYNSGDGNDRIADFGTGQVDRDILVLNDLSFDDLIFTRVKDNDQRPEFQSEVPIFVPPEDRVVDNLLITDTTTGQTITIEGQFSNSVFGLEAIQFADGTLLEREELLAQIVLTDDVSDVSDGTTLSGRGLIYGGSQFSMIVGTTSSPNFGNDTPLGLISLDQLPEADTALFDANSVSQTISGIEIVEFRDATSADVTISRDTNGTLFLTLNSTGQQVRADNFFFDGNLPLPGEILRDRNIIGATSSLRFIKFSDGELFTVADIAARAVIAGSNGDDNLQVDGLGGLIDGGGGADIIFGGANGDLIDGGEGNDELFGDAGDDIFFVRDGDGDDLIDGDAGTDTYDATFANQGITVTLQDSEPDDGGGTPIGPGDPPDDPDDGIPIGPGDPPDDPGDIILLDPSDGNLGDGGGDDPSDGVDILPIDPRPIDPVAVTSVGTATSSDGSVDELESIERVVGGRGDDIVSGSSVDEEFIGNDGDDQLSGGAGDDRLAGGRGADVLDGGEGFDTADFTRARSSIALSLASGTGTLGEAAGDTFTSIEAVDGSNFDDVIDGNNAENNLNLGTGNDRASGNGGDDIIVGGAGDDEIAGNSGDDELNGGLGDDNLSGGEGNDLLIGGAGNDRLSGDFGSDTYVIDHQNNADLIEDSGSGPGDVDVLVLNDLRQDQVAFVRDRDNLIVNFEVFGSVTILGQFTGDGSGVETIRFADGTEIDQAVISDVATERVLGPILAFTDDGFIATAGQALSVNPDDLLANDLNIDGGSIAVSEVGDAIDGTVFIGGDGNIVFTPDSDFEGTTSFTYTATDGLGAFEVATVEVVVEAGVQNETPVIVQPLGDIVSAEDAEVSFTLPEGAFSDPDGDALSLTATLSDGSALPDWLSFDGANFTGTPPQDFNGALELTVTASDGSLEVADSFTLTIDPVADAPEALADSFVTEEDTALQIAAAELIGNDTDVDSTDLSLVALQNAVGGVVSLEDGVVTFTPNSDFFGTASFEYLVTDGDTDPVVGTVTVEVTPVNDAVRTGSDSFDTDEDVAINLAPTDFLANDIDPEGGVVSITSVTALTDGANAVIEADGSITLIPPANAFGLIRFEYVVTDDEGLESSGQVSLFATSVNDAPVLVNELADQSSPEEASFSFAIDPAAFSDVDDSMLSLTATLGDDSALPEWMAFDGANLTGTPPQHFNGSLEITVTASDGKFSASDTFTLTIDPVNDAPMLLQVLPDISSPEDTAFSFGIPDSSFVDVDGDTLTLSATLEDGGALPDWLSFDGETFTGTPPQDFNGSLALTVTASDGGLSASDTFTLTIDPMNDAPVLVQALADVSFAEDTAIALSIPADTFADVDGDALSIAATLADGSDLPAWLSFNGAEFTGTPPQDFNGALNLLVTASDGELTADAAFALTIDPVNDAPVLVQVLADVSSDEDAALSIELPADAFADVDGDALTLSATLSDGTALPAWLDFDGTTFTGTPSQDFNGAFDLTVTASDGEFSVSDTFTLAIDPVNDAPTLVQATADVEASVGDALSIDFANGVFADVDGDALTLSASLADGSALPSWLTFTGGILASGSVPAGVGDFEITVTASDGQASASDSFVLTVIGGNTAPVAEDDGVFVTTANRTLAIDPNTLFDNDVDAEGDALTLVSVQDASIGEVSVDGDGNIIYIPDAVYVGEATFTYTVTDGEFTSTATVTVNIDPTDAFDGFRQGNDNNNRLFGSLFGRNRIFGAGGNDLIFGGFASDELAGGDGNDRIFGFFGNDDLYGGQGNDDLYGGFGFDTAHLLGDIEDYQIFTSGGFFNVALTVDTNTAVDGNDGVDLLVSIERLQFKDGATLNIASPIILDLAGDGVQTVSADESDALFDLDGDGLADNTSWIGANDAFLFLDRDGNGTVSGVQEISFIDDVEDAASDLEGLRAFDSNGDGVLNSEDERFDEFGVWNDADEDGAVDEGETATLSEVGIASVNLDGTPVEAMTQFGEVAIANTGSYTLANGATREFADAALTFFSAATNLPELNTTAYDFDRKAKKYRIHISGGVAAVDRKRRRSGVDSFAGQLGANTVITTKKGDYGRFAPVVLDLDGDGVEMVRMKRSNARFDYAGDGRSDQTGWLSGDDGFLVIDRNNDGLITEASELSLASEDETARTGLQGLANMDSNGDGMVDADDARFSELRVWQDRNGNGRTDAGELMTLEEAGIVSISLAATGLDDRVKLDRNAVTATTSFTRSNGTTSTAADVSLAYRPATAPIGQSAFNPGSIFGSDLFLRNAGAPQLPQELPALEDLFDQLRTDPFGSDSELFNRFAQPQREVDIAGRLEASELVQSSDTKVAQDGPHERVLLPILESATGYQTLPPAEQYLERLLAGHPSIIQDENALAATDDANASIVPANDQAELSRRLMMIRQEMNAFGVNGSAETDRLRSDAPDYLHFYA